MIMRAVLFLMLILSTSLGGDKKCVWEIGRLESVHVASIDPYTSEDFQQSPQLVGPEFPGQPLPDPQSDPQLAKRVPYAHIRFTIRSDTRIYAAERTTALQSEPRGFDSASIAPWVKDLPPIIKFCVKDKKSLLFGREGQRA